MEILLNLSNLCNWNASEFVLATMTMTMTMVVMVVPAVLWLNCDRHWIRNHVIRNGNLIETRGVLT